MLRFKKGEAELTVRGRVSAGTTMINVQGDGLLWTKQPAGGAKITSYETWLKTHHHPATLDLLDQFLDEMSKYNRANDTFHKKYDLESRSRLPSSLHSSMTMQPTYQLSRRHLLQLAAGSLTVPLWARGVYGQETHRVRLAGIGIGVWVAAI